MKSLIAKPRRMALALVLGASLLATASAPPAHAWTYPLLPHVNGLAFFPERPNTETPVFAQLSAFYPNECWQVVDSSVTDGVNVRVTVQRVTGCADTVSTWTRTFRLGTFTAGIHELNVHCTVIDGSLPRTGEDITVPFEVVEASPPPPPGPPYTLPLLEIIQAPDVAPGQPATITLQGFKPFTCTLIHNENATQDSIFAAFEEQASCVDTTIRWTRVFALGSYAEGDHPVAIALSVSGTDSNYTVNATAILHVHGTAPPPPPVDSSTAGVGSSHPNPFRDQSTFSVSLDAAQAVDVAVFDVLGRHVVTIHHGVLPQGTSTLAWNGRRADGSRAPGGIYFYRLTLQDRVIHRQVVLLGTP